MKTTKLLGVVGLVLGSYSLGMAQSTTETTKPAAVKTEPAVKLTLEAIKNAKTVALESVQLKSKQHTLQAQPVRNREDFKRKEKPQTNKNR